LGRCHPNAAASKQFFSLTGALPRSCRACILVAVNSHLKCGFLCMHRNDTKVVSHFYNTPQPGGNQSLRAQDVEASDFLSQFPWCRVATAFMLQDLNRQQTVEGTVYVAPTAAQKMMDRCHHAVLAALQHKSANPSKNHPRSCPWWYLAMTAMHTFCLFAVKVHGDIFAGSAAREEDKCDDIENKVMLLASRRLSQALPLGRGGGV
jgi:hypothetical protein